MDKNEPDNNEVTEKLILHDSICVACGEPVPEGAMICGLCENKYKKEED